MRSVRYDCVQQQLHAGLTYKLPAWVTVFGVQALEALSAVWFPIPHDVLLASQDLVTLETAEMVHVPVSALRLSALIRKDDLRQNMICLRKTFHVGLAEKIKDGH